MTEDDAKPGKRSSTPLNISRYCVGARFHPITPNRAFHSVVAEGRGHAVGRRTRMNVERRTQGLRRFENRPETLLVEIAVLRVRVHQEAVEFQRSDRAFHLLRSGRGILWSKARESRESCRVRRTLSLRRSLDRRAKATAFPGANI